jgi:NAD(P)-dependent dehydrogenase (short-subunit alcohol dehydrogenase family)
MSREFGKEMIRQSSGSIVNISSVAGLLRIADRAAYNASKHGCPSAYTVAQATQRVAIAIEGAARKVRAATARFSYAPQPFSDSN